MALPTLEGLLSRTWPLPARLAVGAVLLLSVVMQLPGVLINFTAQEALDIDAGLSTRLLYWMRPHSPLLTYWRAIGSPTTDPLLAQRALWGLHPARMAALLGLGLLGLTAAGVGLWRSVHGRGTAALAVVCLVAVGVLAAGLLWVAAADPRWEEASADPPRRTAPCWISLRQKRPGRPGAVGHHPLLRHGRPHLVVAQPQRRPGRPSSAGCAGRRCSPPTSSGWRAGCGPMAGSGCPGGHRTRRGRIHDRSVAGWLRLSGQRPVGRDATGGRVCRAPQPPDTAVTTANIQFAGGPKLTGFAARARQGARSGDGAAAWDAPAPDNLRFSVQAVDQAGKCSKGSTADPGALPTKDGYEDRVGLAVGMDAYRLLLRVYDSTDGKALPIAGSPGGEDFVSLPLQDGTP